MRNFKLFIFCFIFFTISIEAQTEIKAKILINSNGIMKVTEEFSKINKNDTLLFNRNINLKGNNELLVDKKIFRNTYYRYLNSDGIINYRINKPKSSFDNFFFHDSIYFISVGYLGQKKTELNLKKKFNIDITIPEGFTLIYPSKIDLKDSFYNIPPIIAGNLNKHKYQDFSVITRKNIQFNKKRMKEILEVIKKANDHFQIIFSKKEKNLEIVFLPFKSKIAGKSIDNLIVLNENSLTKPRLNKKSLIHEILHLWWGDNSIRFDNPVLTEAICEFLALNYLSKQKDFDYLNYQLKYKRERIKNIKNYDLDFNKIKSKNQYKLYCYNLLPVLLWDAKDKFNVEKEVISFYHINKNSFISKNNSNKLLEKLGIQISSK